MVAIVTPMKDGAVDLRALRELTEWQVAEGTDGIVPCGTTGEGVTLTAAEKADVIRTVIQTVRGRAAVIAGAGSNATHEAIESVKVARELGADAALVVTPYYNKPTQEGLFRHYQAIWEAARFPVVAYNVPSRTSVDLLPETVARLAKAGAIVGIKEATAQHGPRRSSSSRRWGRAPSPTSPATTSRCCPTSPAAATASSRSSATSRPGP